MNGMEKQFCRSVVKIALPVTLQSLLQSSFSVIDQMMIGRMGSYCIAGVGLGGKFASVNAVILGAVTTAAGIMISQYVGQKNEREVSRSFFVNLGTALILAALFLVVCLVFSRQIMGIYTKDEITRQLAEEYLRIFVWSCLPMAVCNIMAVLLRCMEAAMYALYAGIAAVCINTGLNYLLIFGRGGFPRMGIQGAALASVISQSAACGLTLFFLLRHCRRLEIRLTPLWHFGEEKRIQYLGILCPVLVCEFLWSLGENVYAAIYGNMGTAACVAMTLTVPVQTLVIGMLSGISQAAGILTGRTLGQGEYGRAGREAEKLMLMGAAGSLLLSFALMAAGGLYVEIFPVEIEVQTAARQVLLAFAVISPVKVQNMILGGGIIRSGGKTKYIMWIDFIGTWIFGVPLGLLAAFVWKLAIPYVYFMLSLEECIRFMISLAVFKKGIWINKL